ncbi:MAG: hypothetical protein Q9163_001840 [Psora crenata]
MPPRTKKRKQFTRKEILNFTVKDLPGLKDLARQRDEMAQSTAADASAPEDRSMQTNLFRWHPLPSGPIDPNIFEQGLRKEREAYEALVGDNGRPCYPIELGYELMYDPGEYEDLFAYWHGKQPSQLVLSAQWQRWKGFREYQQDSRRYMTQSMLPEYEEIVLERRRRHRLDGDVQFHQDQSKQSELDDWTEYQDYELRDYERLEMSLRATRARLAAGRKQLAEAQISGFEGIQELDDASYNRLCHENLLEEEETDWRKEFTERKLMSAERILKLTESGDLRDWVQRDTWVGSFLKEVESARTRLEDELKRLAQSQFDESRYKKWAREQLSSLEGESEEYQERTKELEEKAREVMEDCIRATEEVEYEEEAYEAAQVIDFGETIERAALIKLVQAEIRSAQIQVEQAKEGIEKRKLKRKVLDTLGEIPRIKAKIKRCKVLMEWIEEQRQEISSGRADTEMGGSHGRLTRTSSRAVGSHPSTNVSMAKKPPKESSHKRKRSTATSIPSPVLTGSETLQQSANESPRRSTRTPKSTQRPRPRYTS